MALKHVQQNEANDENIKDKYSYNNTIRSIIDKKPGVTKFAIQL